MNGPEGDAVVWWPREVTAEQWQRKRADLEAAEEDLNHALQALAARRRRLPITRWSSPTRSTDPRAK